MIRIRVVISIIALGLISSRAPAAETVFATASASARGVAGVAGDALDLDQVLGQVLANNPSLRAGRATLLESRARSREASALADPMLDVMAAPKSFGSSAVDAAYR